jgi:hypothetical protein
VSPIDLALGWGPMSDGRILEQFRFSQGGRWYSWKQRNREQPISSRELARYSANMHLIPSTAGIDKQLRDVRAGHIVGDTGGGSCEVIWVRELSVR